MEEVGARVTLKNARKAQKDAKDVARAVDDIGDQARDAGRKMGTMNAAARGLGSGLHGIGTAAAYGVAGAAALTTAFGVRAYRAFDESRRIAAITAQGIRSTGGAANVTANDVAALSQSLSMKTGVDDEAIQSGANMLLTFTKIRNETGKNNDIFNQATAVTTDLAVRLGKDTPAAALMLGKALNDPVKGATALGRAGVQLTEQQKDQIAAFVESGDTLSAQKLILKELDTQVGGSAAAQTSNLDKMKVAWGNVEEAIGSGVYPAVDAISADMTDLAQDVLPSVETAARRVGGIFRSDELDWVSKLKFSGRAIGQELGPEVKPIIDSLEREIGKVDVGHAVDSAIQRGAPVMADAMAAQVPHMASAFLNAFRNAGPGGQLLTVGLLAAKFGAFRGAGTAAAGMFTSSFRTSAASSNVWSTTGATAGRRMGNGLVLHGADTLGQSAGQGKFATAGQKIGSAIGLVAAAYAAKEIGDGLRDIIDNASQQGGIEGFLGSLGGAVDDVTRGGGNLAQFGPLAAPIAAVKDSKRRLDGIGGNTQTTPPRRSTPASPSTDSGRLSPAGPAALPTRGARFDLPGKDQIVVENHLVLTLDGREVHAGQVEREARRQRSR